MNQMDNETREAAAEYAKCQRHTAQHQEKQSIKDFMAGAGWALRNIRWIPVTEYLPKVDGRYLTLRSEGIRITLFATACHDLPAEFLSFDKVIAWCPIPEQLLKSMP